MNSKLILTTFVLSAIFLQARNKPVLPQDFKEQKTAAIAFTENKGQMHDQNYQPRPDVLFGAMAGNMAVHIKKSGVSYQLYRIDKYKEVEDPKTKGKKRNIDQQTIYRIDLNWKGANTNFTQSTDETLPGINNYYLASCPNGVLNVESYTGITLNNLYNGVNLHYYEKDGQLKYDFIVAPKAGYKQIQLEVEGADIEVNTDGSLTLSTPLGKVIEGEPIVYQQGKQLKAKWIIRNSNLSFEIENYDPNQELIIDPVTRLWGTYYGGSGNDYGLSCNIDASGNVYMSGYTNSSGTAIATGGAHQALLSGFEDAFIVKFNSNGVRQWGTYYGDGPNDRGYSCNMDASGNVYLAGYTQSNGGTFIASPGSHQNTYGGGTYDAFLVKFNSSGVRQWGTYYGGSGNDFGQSCNIDASGNVYLAGYTQSNGGTSIATPGTHQDVYGGGTHDAFIVKFNSSGVRQWGTYYGGSGEEQAYSCNTDALGNVYLAGWSDSNVGTVIATSGSHQSTIGGNRDAFLVKFNGGGVRQWGTYYGGSGNDFGQSCSIDFSGNVYLAGHTTSGTGTAIATLGSHQATYGGVRDAFLVKFNSSGARQWGTYYGGTSSDQALSCDTDVSGNVYLAGYSSSSGGTVIATSGSYQITSGGLNDVFLVKFNTIGVRQWGTYYGGTGDDLIGSCATDGSGNVYLVGYTDTNTGTVIANPGSHQNIFGGGTSDAFLVKLTDCVNLNPVATSNSSVCVGAVINLGVTITGVAAPTYSWAGPNSFSSSIQNPSIANASLVNTGVYTVTVDNNGCKQTSITNVIVSMCTNINELENTNILIIYPNPGKGVFNVVLNQDNAAIEVVNTLGKVIVSEKLNSKTHQLNISNQASGIYFIKTIVDNETKIVKIVKE